MNKRFLKFVLPSMLTMLLVGFYAMVDGFFVGQAVGDTGLAAINIAWPVTAVIMALGVGIGTGGAVLLSVARGENDEAAGRRAVAVTLLLLAAASAVATVALVFSYPALMRLLGAEGEVLANAKEYAGIISAGCALQIFGTGLTPLVRNQQKTVQAMLIMVAGLVVNIVLDYVFVMVLDWRLAGAAAATIIAQGVTAVAAALVLFLPGGIRLSRKDFTGLAGTARRALATGLSPFGISLMPSVVVMFTNYQCLAYGGDAAVAAFAVLSYILSSVQLLLAGVGEGIQPLVSEYAGAGDGASARQVIKKAAILAGGVSVALAAAALLLRRVFPVMFGASDDAASHITAALVYFAASFPFIAVNKLFSSVFYAAGSSMPANLLIYLDAAAVTPLFLYTLPLAMSTAGIWASQFAAQALLAVLTVALLALYRKKLGGRI